jgi:quercetin dioxygenase-like cupin family protein
MDERESLIFLIAGEITEIVDGKEFPLRAGDVVFIAAGKNTGWRTGRSAMPAISSFSPPSTATSSKSFSASFHTQRLTGQRHFRR